MEYTLTLSDDELRSLAWIADRYECAAILYDGSFHRPARRARRDWYGTRTGWVLTIPEPIAWAYMAALPEENGDPDAILPPCAGGTLADKLVTLWQEIV